ncbi:glycodelin [Macaca nemestrina]|uniref:glycodelin n=1 Tax=Macaca nemestrina TaxID=9545 RepID=UPI0039B91AB5
MARLWAGLLSAILLHKALRAHTASASLSLKSSEPPRAAAMPCLLLTLGVALVCSVQATDMPQTKQNLELPKLAGTWHSMAMATNNVSLMVMVKSALRVHVTSLWPTPEDHLEMVLHRWENNSCVEKKVLGEKTENPKKFKINYMGANEAMLLDTDYDNFLFLCLTDTTTRIQCLMCQYLARVLVEDDEIMKGFIRAFRPLHKRLWYLLDLRKTEEPCHF